MKNKKPLYKVIIQQESRIILVELIDYRIDNNTFRGNNIICAKCNKELIFSLIENDTLDINENWVTFVYKNIFETREEAIDFIRKNYHLMSNHIEHMSHMCSIEREVLQQKLKDIALSESKLLLNKVKITQFFENF